MVSPKYMPRLELQSVSKSTTLQLLGYIGGESQARYRWPSGYNGTNGAGQGEEVAAESNADKTLEINGKSRKRGESI